MTPRAAPAIALLLAGVLSGCVFDSSSPSPVVSPREYLPLDSPENLLNNLTLSLHKQEEEKFLELLAPEYQFVFSPHEQSACGSGRWDSLQDSVATASLFLDPNVLEIHALIRHGPAVPATEVEMEGTWRVRTSDVSFSFLTSDQVTLVTDGDTHAFYFRPGLTGEGEDPDRWFLVEWRDLSDRSTTNALITGPTPVVPIHWWEIKCGYLSGVR